MKGAIVTRESAYSDPEVLKAQPAFAVHLQTLKISKFRPRLVRFAELQEIIGLAVSQAISEELPAAEALARANVEAEKLRQ